MRKLPIKKITFAVLLCIAVIVAWVLLPILIENFQAAQAYRAYDEESNALTRAIGDLGVASYTPTRTQCYDNRITPFHSDVSCERFATYDYHQAALSPDEQSKLLANAKKLDDILKERGWQLDRPQDNIPSVVALYAKATDGRGGALPMHKNIGPVSCNLDIHMDGPTMTNHLADGAVVVNINEFGCRQQITFFYPNLRSRRRLGP